jgi:DNA end-binding protein Ku
MQGKTSGTEVATEFGADMALRSLWKASIRFSLVSVPVEAFTASEPDDGEIHLNQLHDECHNRIRYQKTCPVHGEVSNSEIVSGYEYEKDHYVVVDKKEIEKVQASGDKSIEIHTFVASDEIDPIYYDGRTFYLTPRAGGEKPYAVLAEAMAKEKRYGLATVVLYAKEQIALVRPLDGVLAMTMLHYKSQIREPEVVEPHLPKVSVAAQELKLAQQLIKASTEKRFDFSQFEDHYTDRLRELIDSKLAGKKIVISPVREDAPPTINLMDALRKSMKQRGVQKTRRRAPAKTQRRKSS